MISVWYRKVAIANKQIFFSFLFISSKSTKKCYHFNCLFLKHKYSNFITYTAKDNFKIQYQISKGWCKLNSFFLFLKLF